MATDLIGDTGTDKPTTELVWGPVGGRCASCGAPLASDQSYCLSCGARRGKPRFPITSAVAPAPVASPPERRPPRPRGSSAATLVAGVATLLIAMGVGVLIGHYSITPTAQRASAPVVVRVSGGGSSAATTPAASNPAATKKPGSVKAKAKTVVVRLTPKLQQKAAAAASQVFGQSGSLAKNVTQQVGTSCSGGAGCQNGKFTGNFFGP